MTTTVEPSTRRGLLDAVRAEHQVAAAAEVRKLSATLDWAVAHEVVRLEDAAFTDGFGETGLTLAGAGAPMVAESSVTELALALGMSSDSGARYVGDALEIRYRLPRLWQRVLAGGCPVWRARRIAQATVHLCEEGADHVDAHVAHVAGSVSFAQLDRLVDDACWRWDPDRAEENRKAAAEHRHVTIRTGDATSAGVVDLDATLDLADALDLEKALRERASAIKAMGCAESLPVRRSMALGDLARGQTALDVTGERTVVLHVHTVAEAVTRDGYVEADHGLARVGNLRAVVSVEQVREWCRSAGSITVRPVLDLAESIHVAAYETSPAQREQYTERDLGCVFPWCTRPAARCDAEHRVPWPTGPTDTENLAPVCRRHHRHKTFLGWTYQSPTPGMYAWTSPLGLSYLRSHAGTHPLP